MLRFMHFLTATAFLICAIGINGSPLAQEQATPEEVVQKVKKAAEDLRGAGETGFDKFQNDPDSVWKDTYVFANNCETETLAAHPVRPELVGTSFADAPDFGDLTSEQVGAMLCETGRRPQGGWAVYLFPKPGEKEPSRKLAYSKAVEGTPYVVTGGIYSEDMKVEDLEKIIGE